MAPVRSQERVAPASRNVAFSSSSNTLPHELTLFGVKQEKLSPVPSQTCKSNCRDEGLSTPKASSSRRTTEQLSSMLDMASPPIFSMDAITDVLGDFVCGDSPGSDDEYNEATFSSANFLKDITKIEQQAHSVAAALFNATQKMGGGGGAQQRLMDSNSAIRESTSLLAHMENPLLESILSPDLSSRCSSPIYTRVQDPLEDGDDNGDGAGDSSSSNNGSAASDSDFELEGVSSPPSDDSSDSDFNVDDSDSEYGAKKTRRAPKSKLKKRLGLPAPAQLGDDPPGRHRKSRKSSSYYHHKSSKSKDLAGGQAVPKPISAKQLETIAATMGSSPVTVNWLLQNYETSEGNSLPRALMYGHYLRHCAELRLDPVNAASFGKLIRSVFVGLTTRRLGTRGNSKYHYCGIRIKDTSMLLLEDPDLSKKTRTNGKRSKKTQILAMQGGICGLGGNKELQLEVGSNGRIEYSSVKKYLGTKCTTFPDIAVSEFYLPDGVTYQDMLYFSEVYRKHCLHILDVVEKFQMNPDLEQIWQHFWQRKDVRYGTNYIGIPKAALIILSRVPELRFAIQNLDAFTYDQILSILMPNVIAQLPFQLMEEYQKIATSLEKWMSSALASYDPEFVAIKMELVTSFKHELQSWISLNLSAQAARDSMQSPSSIAQLLSDLNRINFQSVLMDVKEYVNVDEMDINVHESLKRILSGPDAIEPWSVWLVGLVDQRLGKSTGVRAAQDGDSTVSAVIKECQDLNLRWLQYMSQLRMELLLRSSGSLGTFLSLELLFSNFLLHLIKVYKSRALQVPLVMYSILRKQKETEINSRRESLAGKMATNRFFAKFTADKQHSRGGHHHQHSSPQKLENVKKEELDEVVEEEEEEEQNENVAA